ncbi:MAG: DNA polymerase III subunit epsilon [Alysiella sp.]|uniref:DNA polymerase III subunit epsilon n=1 Tax=Alysiella sp. TaxID=1872483 RepID=UPI0026DC02AF|nr:DNA polymerase III subunit epsilon [Alysiella sp.]MDO4433710.1 DNA polymerase III subunit epsilon [Alysiella sp.]
MSETQRQIILDTETTGLHAFAAENPDRLIEFAGLEMVNRQFTDNNLHLYVHPERDIPEEAIAVHGITLAQLEDKPVFAQVAQQIFDFLKGAELIIHNAPFDVGFLNAEFARVGLPEIGTVCKITDTLSMAREMYPGQKASLDALCTRLGVDRSRRVLHGALIDCELLGGVYLAMTRGQFSLVEETEPQKQQVAIQNTVTTRPEYLKIVRADANELVAHEAYLDGLDKESGGSIYRIV